MLELQQAIEEQKADFQAREVREMQETLEEFLALAGTAGYQVARPYTTPEPITYSKMYGPLYSCEARGGTAIAGSSKCAGEEKK